MTESVIVVKINEIEVAVGDKNFQPIYFDTHCLKLSQEAIKEIDESINKIISKDIGRKVENLKVLVY